tara:strand:+ start:4714 stop:5082 length:369 start_codon:yes stop_codon:yes gene_type:complete
MSALISSLSDAYHHFGLRRINRQGSTPEEIYDSMNLYGQEKPPREEFIAKVNENIPKYLLVELREKRNKLLVESDWTQFRDVVLADDEAWKTYRQALRDLPSQVEPKLNEDMDALFPMKPGQ